MKEGRTYECKKFNYTARTAGIDGETWSTPAAKMKAVNGLSDKKYKAKPLRRVYIYC